MVRLECAEMNEIQWVDRSLMNDAKPIAGRAKLNDGFGDELDDVGDDADEYDAVVSVEPLSNWGEEDDWTLTAVVREFTGGWGGGGT